MKVIIMTDLEGLSLVDSIDMMEGEGYKFACTRLMADLNAAVQGALDAGADEIIVFDGHGGGHNFIPGTLHPAAIHEKNFNADGLFDNCIAYLEVGLHAKAGTLNGFLDHTQSSRQWFNYYVNGVPQGELCQGALYCGAYDVPVVMVSGDEAACNEARELIEGIECAVVKKAIGRNKAECIDGDEAERLIREAACRGIKKASEIKPLKTKMPMELKLVLYRSDYCDERHAANSSLTRVDARTLVKISEKIEKYHDVLL